MRRNYGKYLIRTAIVAVVFAGVAVFVGSESFAQRAKPKPAEKKPVIPKVITLAQRAKLGRVTFNHVKHNGGEYNASGPITCIQCHHTARPAAELVNIPPHTLVWPKDRDTTLTAELFAEDPKKAAVAACRDCHARAGQKPKLLDAMPVIVDPDTKQETLITNEVAFHNACDVCHFEIGFRNKNTKAPTVTNCKSCHKR
ncbi:MAG TPA: cytochrome c3 family protein [Pyrinomonadaceae bacterium]|nr:cytochrome c3 family protein [Pyrinomonadaceae bacterium]